jgi:hypothetical protein
MPLSLGLCADSTPTRTLGLWCYLSTGAVEGMTKLCVSGREIPPHRGQAMDAERDCAANDGGKTTFSSFVFLLLLLPCAIRTAGQPALARATGRVDRRLVIPPRPLRQSLRQHDHEVPHLCAGLVHGVRSSLPLVVVSTHWRRRNSGTTMLKVNDTVESTTDLFFVFHYTLMTWVKRRVSLSPTHVNLTPPKLLQDPERNGTWYVEIYR